MGDVLGARTVVTEGGGGINGALVRADLVEELHIVTVLVLVGGLGTPTFVDGAPLPPGGTPIELHPTGLTQGAHGSTWARYEVRRPATPDAGPTSVTA